MEQFTQDTGIDPIYLAKIEYANDDALRSLINTFGLVSASESEDVSSFAENLKDNRPAWFPLQHITEVYVYPSNPSEEYVSNLWVNANEKVAIIERSWW